MTVRPMRGKVRHHRLLVAAQLSLLVPACVVAALTSRAADWRPISLVVVLGLLALVSDAATVTIRSQRLSGSLTAFVLLMSFAGPAPAAAIGALIVLVDYARARPPIVGLSSNLAGCVGFCVVGGLAVRWGDSLGADPNRASFALVVFGAFALSTVLSFAMTAVTIKALRGTRLRTQIGQVLLPLVPAELAVATLVIGFALAYVAAGLTALTVAVISMLAFQLMLRAVVQSEDRADRLASLQVGVLVALVQTLSLRDKMTARHSAAVARYARALAAEAGASSEEQELVHTAGLLHDIGKFIFPDSILFADRRLTEEDWEVVRRHPAQGARVVGKVDGYGPVAEIIAAHHERPDGKGYPNGLTDQDIPRLSKMISIADIYDVLTARDSYRKPVSHGEAVDELRRVAGTQLDAELVEVFITVVSKTGMSFGHASEADFEAELDFDARVRALAQP